MLVYFTVILIVLMGFCGLAVDVALLELHQIQLQSAADAGSFGGASEMSAGASDWQTVANNDAAAVEAANGATGITNASQAGATSGNYVGYPTVVQTTASQTVSTYFLKLLGNSAAGMALKATSLSLSVPVPCAYFSGNPGAGTSSPSGEGLAITQYSQLTSSCAVFSVPGVEVDSSSLVTGGPIETSASPSGDNAGGTLSQPILNNIVATGDPLAWISAPTYSGCSKPTSSYSNNTFTLSPGVYCNGLSILSAYVTLNPGLYVVEGSADFEHDTVIGTGVTFYFTKNSSGAYGPVNWSSVYFQVSAPTSNSGGGIPGLVVFGDRNWSGVNQSFTMNNMSNGGSDGIYYVSNTGIYMTENNMSGPDYFSVVAANLQENNSTVVFSSDYSTLSTGNPFRTASGGTLYPRELLIQ
jgi:hypothetical protein